MSKDLLHRIFLGKTLSDLNPIDPPVCITTTDTVGDAVTLMSKNKIGSVLITENEELVGIFTERDLIKRIACMTLPPRDIPIAEVMTKDPQVMPVRASVARSVYTLAEGGYRHLPILGKDKKTLKILSIKDIIAFIHEKITKKLVLPDSTIELGHNSADSFFFEDLSLLSPRASLLVKETDTLSRGMEELCKGSGGCVLVVDEESKLSGIFTERDYLEKVVLQEPDLEETRMAQVMTMGPKTLVENSSIALGINTLAKGHFRHLPIMNAEEKLVGFLSVKDFFAFLADRIVADLSHEV